MGKNPFSNEKHANILIPGVFKSMLGIQGSNCIRSEGKIKERYDKKYNHQDIRSHPDKSTPLKIFDKADRDDL